MRKTLNFVKDSGSWYIDEPTYPFSRANLLMVAGADLWLEYFNQNNKVSMEISENPIIGFTDIIHRTKFSLAGGAYYYSDRIDTGHELNSDGKSTLWLCPVTLWVLKKYPKKLFIKINNNEEI